LRLKPLYSTLFEDFEKLVELRLLKRTYQPSKLRSQAPSWLSRRMGTKNGRNVVARRRAQAGRS
jgi:ribosomal protein L34